MQPTGYDKIAQKRIDNALGLLYEIAKKTSWACPEDELAK